MAITEIRETERSGVPEQAVAGSAPAQALWRVWDALYLLFPRSGAAAILE